MFIAKNIYSFNKIVYLWELLCNQNQSCVLNFNYFFKINLKLYTILAANENVSNVSMSKAALFSYFSASDNLACNKDPLVCYSDSGVASSSEVHSGNEGTPTSTTKSCISAEKPHTPKSVRRNLTASQSGLVPRCETSDDVDSQPSPVSSEKMGSLVISNLQSAGAVHRSSEITASTENICMSISETCTTPQHEGEPPRYTRAPDTNSPRLILSHDRSMLASITTPNKDQRSWPEEEWSPKRKG